MENRSVFRMVRTTAKEKAVKAWQRRCRTLERVIMQIKQRQQNLGDNNIVLDVRTKLLILGTYWEQAKKHGLLFHTVS